MKEFKVVLMRTVIFALLWSVLWIAQKKDNLFLSTDLVSSTFLVGSMLAITKIAPIEEKENGTKKALSYLLLYAITDVVVWSIIAAVSNGNTDSNINTIIISALLVFSLTKLFYHDWRKDVLGGDK